MSTLKMKHLREQLPRLTEEEVVNFWKNNGQVHYGKALNLFSTDTLVLFSENCYEEKSMKWDKKKNDEARAVTERVHNWLSKSEEYWASQRNYMGADFDCAWVFVRSYVSFYALQLFFGCYNGGLKELVNAN